MSIFVTQSSMAPINEYIEEISPIFESKRMTNMGPVYKKLQAQLKGYLDVPELSLFVNVYPTKKVLDFSVSASGKHINLAA
ncbi:MAG: hypothetical protein LUD07_06685 [Clostridiales bacterium]|nr:hypothetical protein [Clostridiales bacterium]